MALARLSTGEVFAGYSNINAIVTPVQVGRFHIPEPELTGIRRLPTPLNREGADYLFNILDPNAETMMKEAGFEFAYRRLGCYVPPKQRGGKCSFTLVHEGDDESPSTSEMMEKDLAAYLTPHKVNAHDWHFTFSGAIVKGVQLEEDLQAVVYITQGEWIRLAPTVLNWPIFSFGDPVIAISYYDRQPDEQGGFEMEMYPDHPISETVQF